MMRAAWLSGGLFALTTHHPRRAAGAIAPAGRMARLWIAGSALAVCSDASAPPGPPAALVSDASVAASTANVLAAIVTLEAAAADSVAVRYWPEGSPGQALLSAAVRAGHGTLRVPVFGLHPRLAYRLEPVAWKGRHESAAPPLSFTTGALPADLPAYAASGIDPSPGFVVFAAGHYGLVIDNAGRVVWYHRFPAGLWLNFQAQPNGRYVARHVTPEAGDVEPWVEIDPLGTVTRTFGCHHGLQPRFHDLIAPPDGSYWTMCDETRTMDLSALGGHREARVTGTAVQHVGPDGRLRLHWSAFDHLDIADLDSTLRSGPTVNWTHGNALSLDRHGQLLVSFRNTNEVVRIQSESGTLLWRLGGRRNQFRLDGGSPFAGQHSVRTDDDGRLVLLDNVGDERESRAQRWVVDAVGRTAHLVHAYAALPGVRTVLGGSVDPLPNGRVLVSYGTEGRVEEYAPDGGVVWRIDGRPGYVFRAQRIRSLYHPGIR